MDTPMHITLRRAARVVALTWCLGGGMCSAESGAVEPQVGIPLFLKIITYDENFGQALAQPVRLFVVYEKSVAQSYEQHLRVEEFFKTSDRLLVGGKDVRYQPVVLEALDSMLQYLSPTEYNVLLVTSIGKSRVRLLAGKIRGRGLRSFAFDSDYVPLGLAVGVRVEPRQPVIMINLDSSRKEGSRFSAHLLKMCEVYKD